jgi:hypothetical protein
MESTVTKQRRKTNARTPFALGHFSMLDKLVAIPYRGAGVLKPHGF